MITVTTDNRRLDLVAWEAYGTTVNLDEALRTLVWANRVASRAPGHALTVGVVLETPTIEDADYAPGARYTINLVR